MNIPFLIDSLDIVTTSGIDAWGKPQQLVTASGVATRVERSNRITLTENGEQSVSDFTAFLNSDVSISVGNRVVFEGETFQVLQVIPHKDDIGVHHYEVVGQLQRRD